MADVSVWAPVPGGDDREPLPSRRRYRRPANVRKVYVAHSCDRWWHTMHTGVVLDRCRGLPCWCQGRVSEPRCSAVPPLLPWCVVAQTSSALSSPSQACWSLWRERCSYSLDASFGDGRRSRACRSRARGWSTTRRRDRAAVLGLVCVCCRDVCPSRCLCTVLLFCDIVRAAL